MVFIWKGTNGLMGEGQTLGGCRPGERVNLTEALAEKVIKAHGEASLEAVEVVEPEQVETTPKPEVAEVPRAPRKRGRPRKNPQA